MRARRRLSPEAIRSVVPVLKTVTHPERLGIIDVLREGEKTVGEIAEALAIEPAVASQHLARLKDKDVVSDRAQANRRYYRLTNRCMLMILDCIEANCQRMSEGGGDPR